MSLRDRLGPRLRRFVDRRLESYDLAGLISERLEQFDRELFRMEERGVSGLRLEHKRDEFRRHIRQMERARDGYGEWPESERELVESIHRRYAGA